MQLLMHMVGGMPSGTLLWGMLSLAPLLAAVTPRIHNMFSQRGQRGGVEWMAPVVIWILFYEWINWTKRLAHLRGRSICFSSGQSVRSCAGTQSTVNILWGPAKILPVAEKELEIREPSGLDRFFHHHKINTNRCSTQTLQKITSNMFQLMISALEVSTHNWSNWCSSPLSPSSSSSSVAAAAQIWCWHRTDIQYLSLPTTAS